MNRKTLFLTLLASCFICISCSDDDSDMQNPQNDKNYFPLVVENSWDYQNTVSAPDQNDFESQETLSVSSSNQVGTNTTFEFETTNPVNSAPTTLALSNGLLYKEGNSLIYTGSFGLGLPEFPGLTFDVQDGEIYNKSANEGSELFTFSDNVEESINGFPINIDYTVSSVMGNSFTDLQVNGQNYNDVISSKLVINMNISSNIGIEVDVLESQDVVIVTNYFAKDIGLVKSETDTNFDFISFPSLPLEDVTFFTLQELQSYDVSLD